MDEDDRNLKFRINFIIDLILSNELYLLDPPKEERKVVFIQIKNEKNNYCVP